MRLCVCLLRHRRDQKLRRKEYIIQKSYFPEFSTLWEWMHSVGSRISYKPSTGKQTLIERVPRDTSGCLSVCLWQVLYCWFCCEVLEAKCPESLKPQLCPSLPCLAVFQLSGFPEITRNPGSWEKKRYNMINCPSERITAFESSVAKWSRINLL